MDNYFKSIHLKKNYKAYFGIGNIYYYTKKYQQSIKFYKKALNLEKTNECFYNLSFCYLALQNFERGYELYETRLLNKTKTGDLHQRLEIPQLENWDGKEKCEHLLVVSEQGIGDNLWYYRSL